MKITDKLQLKIWHKMIIGIAIPSLIVLAGSLLTYGYIKNVRDRQSYVQIADDLKGHVLEVRRNEKNFLLHKGEEYYRYCQDAVNTFNNLINKTSPKIVEEIGKEDFLLLKRSSQTYSGLIYDLYVHYQREAEIVEKVRGEGRELETVIAKGKHTGELSTDFIFNLRLLEKNYMLFRDKVSFKKLDAALTQIKNIVPICYECVPYIEAVQNLFAIYKKGDTMVTDLQSAGNSLEEVTNKIAAGERQKISSFITRTLRLLLIAAVLLCILGPFLVYKTANYIVAPIKRLAEITRKIAEGDITLRAPIREHDETFTLAVSFNTMLDHLQLTHESLAQSMNLLREKQALLVE
ncbi:MAG: HAMP domain-containing protein, partial [Nitrospirae bacterium]|nr:HAMP domain-containing protein [Nitrospirota bacterium]